jgi:hypothetical protein
MPSRSSFFFSRRKALSIGSPFFSRISLKVNHILSNDPRSRPLHPAGPGLRSRGAHHRAAPPLLSMLKIPPAPLKTASRRPSPGCLPALPRSPAREGAWRPGPGATGNVRPTLPGCASTGAAPANPGPAAREKRPAAGSMGRTPAGALPGQWPTLGVEINRPCAKPARFRPGEGRAQSNAGPAPTGENGLQTPDPGQRGPVRFRHNVTDRR